LQGKPQAAYAHYQQALVAIEQLQTKIGAEDYKMAFLNDKIEVYEEFIQFCLDQNNVAAYREAFAVFERAKLITQGYPHAASTAEGPRLSGHQVSKAIVDAQVDAPIAQLKRELNRYYTQFHTPDANFATMADATRLNQAIVQCEQRLSNLLDTQRRLDLTAADGAPLTKTSLATLQAGLAPGTMILEYFVTAERVTIFCIEHARFHVHQAAVAVEQLLDLVQQLNFQISKFHLGARFRERHRRLLQNSIDGVLSQLYALLIAPIAGLLENSEQIVVVPHHLLSNLPFHAFFDGKHYLLETHDVVYALSATFHHLVRRPVTHAPARPGLILGLNDTLIQQAEAEATAIAQVFPTAELSVGDQATMGLLLHNAQPRAFIHLATHGVFRADNPAFSALKLADGWLTLQELHSAHSSAPLITLSACDSGRSETLLGDKLVGFYRSFFNAGAQSVVVSLWSLDDQVAIRTMTAFYQAVKAGRPVHQALRTAQLIDKTNKSRIIEGCEHEHSN
jgi:CHAT domain-containing protein